MEHCRAARITGTVARQPSTTNSWAAISAWLRGHSGTAVQDQVELELEPANVVEAGLGEVLLDMLGEVGVVVGGHVPVNPRRWLSKAW
jgi:hypothetical protein